MLKSMTSYGNGEYALGETRFSAEIKSVNNRYRDIILRIPRSLQVLEEDIRSQVAARVRRGRIEVALQMEGNHSGDEYDLELNRPLVDSYLRIYDQLRADYDLGDQLSAHELCQMKDVLMVKPLEVDIESVKPGVYEVLRLALDSYENMRLREGKAIEEDFARRLDTIEGHLQVIEGKAPEVVERYRERLLERVKSFSREIDPDEGRILQEVAVFADRCDITEEILRARSHVNQFRHYMALDEAVGRRLDFLIQEIHREVNTMSAKASDASISGLTVEIKGELEKLREQIQNVE
ncbi:MAG: YicC family protein [Deltaproteobacteria bacterium]|nr:YicC family protein [Deltaproteobacteria bacterium]MBW2127970.1 YicC family protein [Deltaproteobacteria bacterium]